MTTRESTALCEWPSPADWHPSACPEKEAEYQRARAEAALARLRVAVEALGEVRNYDGESMATCGVEYIDDVLTAIGDLPHD